MAKNKDGILGPISGMVGNVVGSSWKGQHYYKARPANYRDANSDKQQKHRSAFAMVQEFLSQMTAYLRLSYVSMAKLKSTYNCATSNVMRYALVRDDAGTYIDYSRVILGDGPRIMVEGARARINKKGNMVFKWKYEHVNLKTDISNDYIMPLVYNIDKNIAIYSTHHAVRNDLKTTLMLPERWKGDRVVAYITAIDPREEISSPSTYLGEFVISNEETVTESAEEETTSESAEA